MIHEILNHVDFKALYIELLRLSRLKTACGLSAYLFVSFIMS